MTLHPRPVEAGDLLGSPEMSLRYPRESDSRVGTTADEGEGTGFDNMFPMAYAERWFRTSDPSERVGAWFAAELEALEWQAAREQPDPKIRIALARARGLSWSFTRGDDERMGLSPMGEAGYRLHYRVDGQWPDGSTEPRPG